VLNPARTYNQTSITSPILGARRFSGPISSFSSHEAFYCSGSRSARLQFTLDGPAATWDVFTRIFSFPPEGRLPP